MKGLIVYCLDRIIRRGCRSCLHWYLSVLSRLIDTLDCYISKLKTFSAGFHSRFLFFNFFYFFSLSLPPLRLVIKKFGRASWQFSRRKGRFYLAPPGVYSKSSDKSHKTWMTLRLLILMMKVHHQLLCEFRALSDVKLNCNQSAVCKHLSASSSFFNKYIYFLRDCWWWLCTLCITCARRKQPTSPPTATAITTTYTLANAQCVIIAMKYATRD